MTRGKGEKDVTQHKKKKRIDGERRRAGGQEARRMLSHTSHPLPRRSRIRPTSWKSQPSLNRNQKTGAPNNSGGGGTAHQATARDASQARLKVRWLRALFKAHQRTEINRNKARGDALKIWQECDSPTQKAEERGEASEERGRVGRWRRRSGKRR